MSRKYGELYRISDFIANCLPSPKSRSEVNSFDIFALLDFMKQLDRIQAEKGFVYTVRAGGKSGGMSFFHDGGHLFYLLPRVGAVTVLLYHKEKYVHDYFNCAKGAEIITSREGTQEWNASLWRIPINKIEVLLDFFKSLSVAEDHGVAIDGGRRNFSGAIKEAAFRLSQSGAFECPGFSINGKQKRKPHKFEPGKDGYHFDHVVPFSLGGPSKSWNVRVLCADCNSKKSAYPPPAAWGGAVS